MSVLQDERSSVSHPDFPPYNWALRADTKRKTAGQGVGADTPGRLAMSYTILEGTSEIQRLVIARSISGVHIP